MRQVNRSELLWNVVIAMRRIPQSYFKDAAGPDLKQRDYAKSTIADQLVRELDRFEVLTSAPLNHPAGDDLFTRAAYRDLGDDDGSGVPTVTTERAG